MPGAGAATARTSGEAASAAMPGAGAATARTSGEAASTATALLAVLRLGVRRVVAEPAGLIFAGALYLMVTSVLGGLWRAAANANGGEIVGYSATALVWYIAASEAATIAIPLRLIEEVGDEVRTGRAETDLLRPADPLLVRLGIEIGRLLPRLGVCALLGIALALVTGGRPPGLAPLALAAPSLLLATGLNIVAQHAFAGATFWLRDANSAWFLYQKLVFVLGGMLLPLQVLPDWLEVTARILPFAAMAYAPARLASGHFEPELLITQLAWLAAFLVLTRIMWHRGERRIRAGLV